MYSWTSVRPGSKSARSNRGRSANSGIWPKRQIYQSVLLLWPEPPIFRPRNTYLLAWVCPQKRCERLAFAKLKPVGVIWSLHEVELQSLKVRNFRLIETDVGLGPTGIASSDVMCVRGGTRLQNAKPQEWCKIRQKSFLYHIIYRLVPRLFILAAGKEDCFKQGMGWHHRRD